MQSPPRTISVSVSKTINAPAGMLLLLFRDSKMRERWMRAEGEEVVKSDDTSLRLKWRDGTFVAVSRYPKSSNKTQVAVQHEGLPDKRAAEIQRKYWAEQLQHLKQTIE